MKPNRSNAGHRSDRDVTVMLHLTEPEQIRNIGQSHDDTASTDMNFSLPSQTVLVEPRSRQESVTQAYYNSSSSDPNDIVGTTTISKGSTKQSPQLPRWMWYVVAKCLGIPLHTKDRPILATVLHVLTFSSALTFFVSLTWLSAYDIMASHEQSIVLHRTMTVLIVACWCALGLYAKKLCLRVFQHPQFMRDIRMHTRTFFRINAAFVVFFLGATFTVVNNADYISAYRDETCWKVNLPSIVCKIHFISKIIYSLFALVWNTFATSVFMSVCRTHTIGIRRFIRELEQDAVLNEIAHAYLYHDVPLSQEIICQETAWLEAEASEADPDEHFKYASEAGFSVVNKAPRSMTFTFGQTRIVQERYANAIPSLESEAVARDAEIGLMKQPILKQLKQRDHKNINSQEREVKEENNQPLSSESGSESVSHSRKASDGKSGIMSCTEILHRHWKISCRLRLVSSAFQRWFSSFICMVIIWCAIWLVTWLKTRATIYGILQFVLPLLLLPILCSAMAEVNLEGQRVCKCICPKEDRLQLIQFLTQNPIQMTVYGYTVNYGTIMTVVFAILAAFVSRLMFAELGT